MRRRKTTQPFTAQMELSRKTRGSGTQKAQVQCLLGAVVPACYWPSHTQIHRYRQHASNALAAQDSEAANAPAERGRARHQEVKWCAADTPSHRKIVGFAPSLCDRPCKLLFSKQIRICLTVLQYSQFPPIRVSMRSRLRCRSRCTMKSSRERMRKDEMQLTISLIPLAIESNRLFPSDERDKARGFSFMLF